MCLTDSLLLGTCSKLENQPREGFSAATSIWLLNWLHRAVRFHTDPWSAMQAPVSAGQDWARNADLAWVRWPGRGRPAWKPFLQQTRASSIQGKCKSCVGSSDFQKRPKTTFYVKYFHFEILAINFLKNEILWWANPWPHLAHGYPSCHFQGEQP